MSEAKGKKFLDSYGGQTVDQLIAMESDYRIDSLVLAFEGALLQKQEKKKLSRIELDILAVEAMEREVNNGGYHQFFLNSSKKFAAILPSSLERIGCPAAAKITSDALAYLKISGDVTVAKIDAALDRLGDKAITDLGKMDNRYFQNKEAIADKLFTYIKANKGEIVLK
ncbi:DUF4375 domain-containing protein [Undibacterium sp. LX40W]|uniref:DUF4375 domain-containing protein n=1 Tax=Undibacterium nitidum TaxID=2762298 RepID=A0A923HPP4_9BURK|nr:MULTISPECIES: DUF4375 domain-containing protein [Undibacterium]MBC3883264.1 DUF4375 domain-containing protein [Undibacterium nitidum]MBC3893589.1 DUF4375 domain-containing protein [Undibacterium sp. LX40W]